MRSPSEVIVTGPVDLSGRFPVIQAAAATALAQAPCRFISCMLWRTSPDWSIPERRIDDLFLFLPVDGDLSIHGPQGSADLVPGSVAIVPVGVPHAVTHAGGRRPGTVLAVHAHVTTSWGTPWPFPADRLVASLPEHARWIHEFQRLAGLAQDHPQLGAALGRSLVRRLLVETALAGHPIGAPAGDLDPRVAAIVAAVQADPGAAPAISTLARGQGIGPLRLRQLFHAALGCTPKTFVDRLRLARAAELLRAGRPVGAVASACGYGTIRQLQVRFKAAYGVTPSDWARQPGDAGP